MNQPVLTLQEVTVRRFEQTIIDRLDVVINEGDFVMLIGPNGSGKSTLMKVLNGTIKPNQGQVVLRAQKINNWPVHEIAQHIATLTQDIHNSTFSELTVAMNLDLALKRGPHGSALKDKMAYLANFSESLKERLTIAAGKLSGGQRQALALAMCFAHKPKVVLLDEHTSALDPKAARALMQITGDFVKRSNVTTVMISHNLEQVLAYGNRLIVLNQGRIAADFDAQAKQKLSIQELIALAY
jgi:putative ABC transport system ATP-binding protein